MNIPTAPITLASQSTCASGMNPDKRCRFSWRHAVLFVAAVELLGSLAGMCIYGYAAYVQPAWNHVVPIPHDLCNAKDIVRGVMFIFILLFTLEFFLTLCLVEGARKRSLGKLRYWLAAMLTYVTLVTVVILGMEFGGIRSATMNAASFINIFLRFLEILIVYVYVERETMRRNKITCNLSTSTMTISTVASQHDVPPGVISSSPLVRGQDEVISVQQPDVNMISWRRMLS